MFSSATKGKSWMWRKLTTFDGRSRNTCLHPHYRGNYGGYRNRPITAVYPVPRPSLFRSPSRLWFFLLYVLVKQTDMFMDLSLSDLYIDLNPNLVGSCRTWTRNR